MVFSGAVEGDLDEAVLRRLTAHCGLVLDTVYGKRGKSHLLKRIDAYNSAARFQPWIVLIDLDNAACAPAGSMQWLPSPAQHMRLRLAVRAVES